MRLNPVPPALEATRSPQLSVQIVQHLKPGGIETMALEFCRQEAADTQTHIISLEGEATPTLRAWPRLKAYEARLHFLNKPPGLHPPTVFRLMKLLRRLNATCVHSHHVGPLLYGGLAARMSGLSRLVHTEHDAWHLADPARARLQKHLLKALRPTLIADCTLVADQLAQTFPGYDCQVIPNGIDCQRFSPADKHQARALLGLPAKPVIIGSAGRLETVKGQDLLLQAFAALPGHLHLALAGGGSQDSALRQLSHNLGITERVHFLKNLEDMPSFYRALDLFCLPSRQEGMPLSPLEAQSCGCPTVVTDVGGARDALCPATGHLASEASVAALLAALTQGLQRLKQSNPSPRAFVLNHANQITMLAAYSRLQRGG